MSSRTKTKHDANVETQIHEIDRPHPNGPAFAAIIAASIGSFVLGLFTTLAEASESVKEFLVFREPVGPLSGKTGLAVAAWLASWLAFGFAWRKRDVDFRTVLIVSMALIVLGIVGTFPTFFEQFAE